MSARRIRLSPAADMCPARQTLRRAARQRCAGPTESADSGLV